MNWTLLQNSLVVSGMTTAFSVLFGFVIALWLLGLVPRWRRRILLGVILPLALPPFLVVDCWLHFLGATGVWRSWLPVDIYSLPGTVWILTLLSWPITTLAVLGAWTALDAAQLEADPAVTGPALLRWLLAPMARPGLAMAVPLTFVLALNNFAVPAILQVKVLPAEIWVRFSTRLDQAAAWNLSWPLIVAPLLLVAGLARRPVPWPGTAGRATAKAFRRQLGGAWYALAGVIALLLVTLSVGLPIGQILANPGTWTELANAYRAGASAFWNSFLFAAIAASVAGLAGLAGYRLRLGWLLWLPLLVPGVLLGIALIFVFNRDPFQGLYQSSALVILALALRYLGLPWNGIGRAVRNVDPTLVDQARLEGASRWQLVRYAYWPQIAAPTAAVFYLTYILCLWDVETLLLIIPPGGETLALRVFNLLHYGHTAQVNALCLLLLLLALAPGLLWALARRLRAHSVILPIVALGGLCGCIPDPGQPLHSQFFQSVQVIGTRGTALGQLNKPRSVAVDEQDNLYVVDMTGRVQKFSAAGSYLGFWQMPQTDKGKPKGMGIDHAGNILVLEPHYSRVSHFLPDGKLVAMWGRHGTNTHELAFPRALATASNGDIFVSEYGLVERVQRFSPFGTNWILSIGHGGAGPGEFNRPEGLGIDDADRLYVADSCNHRVQVFSGDGQWLGSFGSAGKARGELSYPYDVRIDTAGYQFVCEFGNSRIQIFDPAHQAVEVLGGSGSAPGEFNNPWSIALDSRGNLYVADANNHRVQKFIRKTPVLRRKETHRQHEPRSQGGA